MALTKCAECGHEVSDLAAACPQCGCPQGAATAPGPPASETCPAPPPPSAPGRWWTANGNKADGPYNEAYIVALLQGGTIGADSMACAVDGSEWKPLSQWPQFANTPTSARPANLPSLTPPSWPAPWFASPVGILTNPRLPRMANWICIYCLAVSPMLMILSLPLRFISASSEGVSSPTFGLALLWNVVEFLIGAAVTAILFFGGLKLKRLETSGCRWVMGAMYASLGSRAFLLVGGLFVWAIQVAVTSGAVTPTDPTTGEVILIVFTLLFLLPLSLASIVFEIVALVWLHRQGKLLPVADFR